MSYYKIIEKTINYIEVNLKDEINIDCIALNAKISKFHFHRIFSAVVDETIMEYIRKRRLSCAAIELVKSNKRILEIAIDYCFNSNAYL